MTDRSELVAASAWRRGMRRGIWNVSVLLVVALLCLLPSAVGAQDFIRYYPPGVVGLTSSGTELSSTLPLQIYNSPSTTEYVNLYWLSNEFLIQTTGASRNIRLSTPSGGWDLNGSFAHFAPSSSDALNLGFSSKLIKNIIVSRGLQGSKSTALADNTKKAFVTVAIAAGSYVGGDIVFTLYCADAADRVSRSGRVTFAAQNTGGTETCSVGTPDVTGDVTNNAKAFTSAAFTCADGGTNAIQIEVQADCTIATPTTLTIEHRLDMPTVATLTPAT